MVPIHIRWVLHAMRQPIVEHMKNVEFLMEYFHLVIATMMY